jgi:hypothetical protein
MSKPPKTAPESRPRRRASQSRGSIPTTVMPHPGGTIGPMRLDQYLTDEEFDALETVDEGINRPIAKHLSDRLLDLGYIHETPEGLRTTSPGQMRLALGK